MTIVGTFVRTMATIVRWSITAVIGLYSLNAFMKKSYIIAVFLGALAILAWSVFQIQENTK